VGRQPVRTTTARTLAEPTNSDSSDESAARRQARSRKATKSIPVIPGYQIESVLARGSSATVYRARQNAVDREVALKVLHPELAGRKRVVMRLKREAKTSARLAHPHIVSAIDMGQVDGLWWFAMELVNGPSLALRLRQNGALSEREALRLFIPLSAALVHLSEHGVVHRDIKPANILIDDSGGARLADLGLAFSDGDPVMTVQGGTLGTPHYISPEQARDPSTVDERADLWSFGATLYHALCGEPPFHGSSLAEVLAGVLHAPIADPSVIVPELSKGIVLVLRKCLSRDLSLRYSSPGALLLDLERVRERRSPLINARALEPLQARPNSYWVPTVTIVCVIAIGLLSWIFGRENEAEDPVEKANRDAITVPAKVLNLAHSAEEDASQLGPALRELVAYADTAPLELSPALRTLESELLIELRLQLRLLREQQEAELAQLISSDELSAARYALDVRFEKELQAQIGFGSSGLPVGLDQNRRAWLSEVEREFTHAVSAAIGVLVRAAEGHYERVLLPAVELDIENHAWRSARAKLNRSPMKLAVAAGAKLDGLSKSQLDEAFASMRARLRVRENLLIDEWSRIEAGLHRWIGRRAEELEKELRERQILSGAALALKLDFERKLTQDGFDNDEFLQPEGMAIARDLERRCTELSELEDHILSTETMSRFEALEELFAEQWSSREYESLLNLWKGERDKVGRLTVPSESNWRERQLAGIEVMVRQAELLQALLESAARNLGGLNGSELEVSLRNIPIQGRLILNGDPLRHEFDLRTRQGVRELNLRDLDARDLLTFAMMTDLDDGEGREIHRLTAALLYFRDGNSEKALTVLSLGALPQSGVDGRLVRYIEDHSLEALRRGRASELDRNHEAQALFDEISAGGQGRDQVSLIENLLQNYSDTSVVRSRVRELRKLKERWSQPSLRPEEADYRVAFDPLGIEMDRERVRLIFEFGKKTSRAWKNSTWEVSGGAWVAPTCDNLFDRSECGGPQLQLRQADVLLDTSSELRVLIDLEFANEEQILFSAAGFHISVFGTSNALASSRGWLVTAGSREDHLIALSRGRGELEPFLRQGTPERLEFFIRARSGRVALIWNGEELDQFTVQSPRVLEEVELVELRAAEGTRLLRMELEVRRP
jgi:serine/threonine protein kinase